MFLPTFLHILGVMKHVTDNINEVKGITKNTNVRMDEGFNKTQGKDIWLTFWFVEIHLVKYQKNSDDIGDVTWR